jgi:hypothetical protein
MGRVLRGPEATKAYFTTLFETFDWRIEPDDFIGRR